MTFIFCLGKSMHMNLISSNQYFFYDHVVFEILDMVFYKPKKNGCYKFDPPYTCLYILV